MKHAAPRLVASSEHEVALDMRPLSIKALPVVQDWNNPMEMATLRLEYALSDDKDTTILWPIPSKILCFLIAFAVLEYVVDYLPWATIRGGVQPEPLPFVSNPDHEAIYTVNANEVGQNSDVVGQLSVLTLNVWVNRAQENVNRQIKGIRELRPDVICLQEVFHLDVLEAYRTAFPEYRFIAFGRGHSFTALCALLAIMIALATASAGIIALVVQLTAGKWRIAWLLASPLIAMTYLRVVRHHWTVAFLTGNRTGLAMLVRREAVALDDKKVECIAFSSLAHGADLLNWLRPRGFINAPGSLKLPGGQHVPVRFSTTHLNQPLEQRLGAGRHRQVQEVLTHCLHDNEFFVLGCDLNATPPGTQNGSDCCTYQHVCAELSDAWAATNPNDPCRDGLTWDMRENPMCTSMLNNLFYGASPLRWRCDYIFWRYRSHPSGPDGHSVDNNPDAGADDMLGGTCSCPATVRVRSCDIVFTGTSSVSDHFGVHSTFDFRVAAPTQ